MGAPSSSASPIEAPRPTLLRRWAPWLVIAVVVVVAGVVGVHRPSHPSLEERTASLAAQIRCPVCEGQSVAQSQAPPSLAIVGRIHDSLAAGQSPAAVMAGIVGSYGPGILERPRASGVGLVVWLAPVLALACAVAGLALAFRRWRRSAALHAGASDDDRELVRAALRAGACDDPAPRAQ